VQWVETSIFEGRVFEEVDLEIAASRKLTGEMEKLLW